MLERCPRTPLPTAPRVRLPAPAEAPGPAPTPAPRSDGKYFANCDAVRAAGRAPLLRGDPAYAANPRLDRDKDGVACE